MGLYIGRLAGLRGLLLASFVVGVGNRWVRAPRTMGAAVLLAAASCSQSTPEEPANGLAPASPQDAAETEDLVRQAAARLRPLLTNPDAAHFFAVRSGTNGAICGSVASPDASGNPTAARPFVVPPDGDPLISRDRGIHYEDPSDPFADAYLTWCASEEELRSLSSGLQQLSNSRAPDLSGDNIVIPSVPEPLPLPPPESPPPGAGSLAPRTPQARERQPRPQPRTPAPDDDSFYNAILR